MQVQSIANTKSDIKFKSASATDKAAAFVNMDDAQLRYISYASGKDKNQEKKNRRSLLKIFYAIPVVDTIASAVLVSKSNRLPDEAVAALRKTKLSTRLGVAAGTAAFWAISLSAIELYNVCKKAVEVKSPSTRKFNRENPVTSFVTDITAILLGGTLGLIGLGRLTDKYIKKHPEKIDEADRSIRETKAYINASKFNQETLPKFAENMTKFAEKRPWLAKTGRLALANSVLILLGVGFLKMIQQSKNEHNRVEKNYKQLKQTQLVVAKHLVNNLSQEKNILVKELISTAEAKKQAEAEVKKVKKDCCECEAPTEKKAVKRQKTAKTESVEE